MENKCELQTTEVSYDLKVNEPVPNEICFNVDADTWLMKLSKEKGILFNREGYPHAKPDDFAQAVIDILEKSFNITFARKREDLS